jgi:hypothetical protein
MSHHYSGPDFGFPHGDARLDFCDLYALPKPEDSSRSVLIMDVHPSMGVNPEGPTSAEPFASEAIYELKIDTDGDAVADIAYRIRFSPSENGGPECDGAPHRGRRCRRDGRRRGSDHRGCSGVHRLRSAGDAGWRVSLLRGLA